MRTNNDGSMIDDGLTEVMSDGKTLTRGAASTRGPTSEMGQSKTELSTASRLLIVAD